MSIHEVVFMTAADLVHCVKNKELSCREVMEAHLAQIESVNPKVNAIVTQVQPEQALSRALALDEALARGDETARLHGLPVAHKDLVPTRGLRTTFGSPIFRNHVPDHDALIVERIGNAGGITIGKTNTPEFGAGSQTFNEVFGETLNPYDTSKTCGGSSGGAAVALACGMIPLADGSDLGGSLRNPANFCNVVGFRPSPGRVPVWPTPTAWFPLMVEGPMARTVRDVALMLSAIAGPDPRSPISIPEPGRLFARLLERDFKGVRIAWSSNLGGLPVDRRVTGVLESQRGVLEDLGCTVVEGQPDFSGADEIFRIWRGWLFALRYGALLKTHRHMMKDTVVWNIEEGLKITGSQIGEAEVKRTELYHRVQAFLKKNEFLICPVNQVPPFDVKERWVKVIEGVQMKTYIDWMRTCYYITVTGLPAISVPCGFTPEGLPVGMQIVGRHNDDFGVLQLGHAFEQATQLWKRRPLLVR
jgi:amidase